MQHTTIADKKAAALVVVDNLKAARAKIEKPENWLQRALSTNKKGYNVLPDDPEACRFCSVGAIRSVMPDQVHAVTKYPEGIFLNTVVKSRSDAAFGIVSYNDSSTHAEVLSAFDEAIQLATEAANAI